MPRDIHEIVDREAADRSQKEKNEGDNFLSGSRSMREFAFI
jgi:hypothetical protein